MRAHEVFAGLSPEGATRLMRGLAERAPGAYSQALGAACVALKARPVYMRRQPFEKSSAAVRRALARVSADELAEEMLAAYFLECRKPLLIEWLDALGIPHEDGILSEDEPAQPPADTLLSAARKFCGRDGDPDRALLLRAFAAQSAIDWPDLESYLRGTS